MAELVRRTKESLLKLAPVDYKKDSAAKERMDQMLELAGKIAIAEKTEKPPVIDGKPDEQGWRWSKQEPWFVRNSAVIYPFRTQFAFTYDNVYLYVAFRCQDQSVDIFNRYRKKHGEKATRFGTNGSVAKTMKNTPSVRLFINQDLRDGNNSSMQEYQLMPNCYGGLWENREAVEKYQTTWDAENSEWQTEVAIRWDKLGMSPGRLEYLRLNVLRHIRGEYNREVGGWYLSHETRTSRTAKQNERGWLVFAN